MSQAEIKTAYHRALLSVHPDKVSNVGSPAVEVGLVREAWRVLGDDSLRKEYDKKLKGIFTFCKD